LAIARSSASSTFEPKVRFILECITICGEFPEKKKERKEMKISKKLCVPTLFMLLVLSVLVLAACGGGGASACSPNCAYEDMVVGFLQTGSEGGWRAANTASFKETAEQLGITLKFYDSQNDLAKQVAGFHQFNEDPEVNVIILAALETTG
jgi:ABC-type sugar transport system substrate-binding protein